MPRPKPSTESVDLASAFEGIVFDYDPICLSLPLRSNLPTIGSKAEIVQSIMDRVERNVRPAGQLKTSLGRIVLYKKALIDAVEELLTTYSHMTAPKKPRKLSAVQQARYEMLADMPDKMLKDYAAKHMDVSDYILPDERESLIDALVECLTKPAVEA